MKRLKRAYLFRPFGDFLLEMVSTWKCLISFAKTNCCTSGSNPGPQISVTGGLWAPSPGDKQKGTNHKWTSRTVETLLVSLDTGGLFCDSWGPLEESRGPVYEAITTRRGGFGFPAIYFFKNLYSSLSQISPKDTLLSFWQQRLPSRVYTKWPGAPWRNTTA